MRDALTCRCYFQESKKYRKMRFVSREATQETSSLLEACIPMGEGPERSREKIEAATIAPQQLRGNGGMNGMEGESQFVNQTVPVCLALFMK